MCRKLAVVIFCLSPTLLPAQQKSELQQVLDRLDRIEQENRDLAEQVRALRAELGARTAEPERAAPAGTPAPPAAPAPLAEKVAVNENRIAEQAQTKVEASQKLPIVLTGMVLFNSFLNGRANGGSEYPTIASVTPNYSPGGATLSQSVVGLKFQGPQIFGGGQISGSAFLDAWGGTTTSSLNHLIRLRTATVQIDWKNTTVLVGQDKPIVSPREPNSLAQVAVSPLTGSGNLWLWSPQVRVDQRFAFGSQAGLTAQLGVYETSEPSYAARGGDNTGIASTPRPALEGRFELWRKFGESARIEVAPGFHDSTSHAGGFSAPSHLFTVDWLIQPVSKIQFTGMFFTGENAAGLGGLRQGFTIFNDIRAVPVGATGGWAQLSILATKRLTFNIFGGQENDNIANLLNGDIHTNSMYAGNAIYRLGSNVLLGAEVSQVRTNYFLLPSRLNNHYDLSLAYLF
jgi:hypothetical protein